MAWLQLSLTTSKERAPLIEALFDNMGALSTTLTDAGDDPILEPGLGETPLWQATTVTALFEGERDPDELRCLVGQSLNADCSRQLEITPLETRAWERAWMADFHPMPFGRRLWVCPAGQRPAAGNAIALELDPGLAFGTGTHPTTALCLEWLDGTDLEDQTVLDFGCGSGILAIAALLLGARQAVATDHDPQALQATRDNARKNRVESRLAVKTPEQLSAIQADILLANILAGTLIQLEPRLAAQLKPGGRLLLSGILVEQADAVSQAFSRHFRMRPPTTREGWVALEGIRTC